MINSKKKVWLDLETTGLYPSTHGIVQLAMLIEENNKIIDEICLNIKPFKGCEYTKEASETNGLTKK